MKRCKRIILLLGVFVFAASGMAFAQEDRKGCRDHPMFTRMPNFYIEKCKEYDFDQADFVDEKGKDIKVERKYYWAEYEIKKDTNNQVRWKLEETLKAQLKRLEVLWSRKKGGYPT